MIGKIISHYKILKKLGEGGMGVVYKAEDTKLKRTIALKFLPRDLTRDTEAKERFVQEAQAAAALNHPNICTIHEIDEADGQLFIAMEYIEGQSLKEKIESGPLDVKEAVDIAVQVGEGLQEAHKKGIIHRDIKSANIMVTEKGQTKIMDFGLAKLAGQVGLTKTGTTLGTVAYMSPEQARGEEVDHRTDIWSLGVVLYELLTGQLPFRGEYEQAVVYSIMNEDPEKITGLRTSVPTTLQGIVENALEKQSRQRYQHINEMIVALRCVRDDTLSETCIAKEKKLAKARDRRLTRIKILRSTRVKNFAKNRRTAVVLAGLFCVVAVFALLLIFLSDKSHELYEKRVAVVSFENRTGDKALDHIGRMISDWIVQGLVQTELVSVVPVMDSEMVNNELQMLASKTHAHILVSGWYYKQNEQLQIHAQIYNAKKREVLKAIEPISGSVERADQMIELVRQRTVGGLASALDPNLWGLIDTPGQPPKYEALHEYIKGMDYFGGPEYDNTIKHFKRAIELEPAFILPLFFSAWTHYNHGEYAKADSLVHVIGQIQNPLGPINRYGMDCLVARLRGDYRGALSATRKAARLSPTPGSYFQLGFDAIFCNRPREAIEAWEKLEPNDGWKDIPFFWDFLTFSYHLLGNHKKELKLARQSREHFPELFYTHYLELRALVALGKVEDVYVHLDESLTLPSQQDGTHGGLMRITAAELRAHGHEEPAKKVLERAIDWYTSHPKEGNQTGLAYTLYAADRWEEAQALFDSLHLQNPDNIGYLGSLGTLAAKRGDRVEAMRISQLLEEVERPYIFGNHTYWQARIAAQLGEKEKAMSLLRDALSQGVYHMQFHNDMDLEPLWDYPPFQQLIKPEG